MSANQLPNAVDSDSDKSIGDIIRQANNLTAEQVERVLEYQKDKQVKFGEAAVALGYVRREDVLWALSQQFHYPYSPSSQEGISEELVVASNPFGATAEAFRDLRSQLLASVYSSAESRRPVAIVSPDLGDGKSFFAANIAVALSQLGGRTLLVDADMRTPRQHEIFGASVDGGLSGILSGRSETSVIRPISDLPSLFLLPVGVVPPNPLELVQRPAFGQLLGELMQKFDYVIVDTPAAVHGSDVRVIASVCGAALVIGRKGASRIKSLQKLVSVIQKNTPHLLGVVMNEH